MRLLPVLVLLACLAVLLAPSWSQTGGISTPAASSGNPASDTLLPGTPAANQAVADSSRPKSRADTVLVVKHRFNHREQLITGSVVMTCLALMMVVMNNYNPR